jgi:hypothetical protein
MTSRTRELRIEQSVACPACGARAGEPCAFSARSQDGGYLWRSVHSERRDAYQRERGEVPQGQTIRCACGHTARQHRNSPSAAYPDAPPQGCKLCDCAIARDEVRAC